MHPLKYKIIPSPVGLLKIVTNSRALVAILWDNEKLNRVRLDQMVEESHNPLILETEKQLTDYFLGHRKNFNLPLEILGTPFQQEVWRQLEKIAYGSTWTYKEVSTKIDHPTAIRAVGTAIGRNPISIIIPCHRVIGTNGNLTGFAGGLERKKFLLDLESA